jgi:replicative DNA helicase
MKPKLFQKWEELPPEKSVPIRSNTEQAALSLMIQDNEILSTQKWDASYFALENHRLIFEALQGFHSRNGICDEFTLISELENRGTLSHIGGDHVIHDILKCMNIPSGKVCQDIANDYRKELREAKIYRDLIQKWEEMEMDIRRGNADVNDLSVTIESISHDEGTLKRTKKDMLNQIIDEMEGKSKQECFGTGLLKLDRTLKGGMHRGELMTVAAETGGGKSILLVQSAVANLLDGKSVLFFSLEMSGEDVFRRMAANIAGVPIREMEDYKSEYGRELPKVSNAIGELLKMKISVVDCLYDIDEIESEISRAVSSKEADVIIVDYLQIINMPNNDNRENAISEAARRLKNAAGKNRSVILTASQLNDEGKLRESRAIGMHSDQVVHIEHLKEKSRIVVKKNRRGPRNYIIDVKMNGELSKLEEVW